MQLGLAFNPYTDELWETENGPNGGDEINVIQAGPELRLAARQLRPRLQRAAFQPDDARKEGMEQPTGLLGAVDRDVRPDVLHRRPLSGLEGQRLRRRHAAKARSPRSGQLQRIVFNDKWEELRREPLLRELHQRIRDVRQGPDGLLYLLTEEDQAALLRIEPAR